MTAVGATSERPNAQKATSETQVQACKRGPKSIYICASVRVVTYSSNKATALAALRDTMHRRPVNSIICKSSARNVLPILLSASALLFALLPASAIIDATLQMQLGNPSGATADTNNHTHYLIQRPVEAMDYRSEEHTSELQTPCNLLCRL